jgi:hypothetical protein
MLGEVKPCRFLWLLFAILFSTAAFAQFTASIQGVVQDSSGAGIAKATVRLVNASTAVSGETTTDSAGN